MKKSNLPDGTDQPTSPAAWKAPGERNAEPAGTACDFLAMILEDESVVADLIARVVHRKKGRSVICGSLEEARRALDRNSFEMFLLDQGLPDGQGSCFFRELREAGITAPCIMLTGQPDFPTAVELTRNGLLTYLVKPFDINELEAAIEQGRPARRIGDGAEEIGSFVGVTAAARQVRWALETAAFNREATVLLTGETGVGKDLAARLIHQLSFRGQESPPPFVSLNCANLQTEMFEAELFGAEKGSYTGSHQLRIGLAEAAKNGTLFLDEIGELPMPVQSKFLQFLETREFRRLGHSQTFKFAGRIIAATNRRIEDEVKEGRFRADLWYRLDVISIELPPLRERKEDLPFLADLLLANLAAKYGRSKPNLSPEKLDALSKHDFPGNVRELRNLLERSLLATPAGAAWLELDPAWMRGANARPASNSTAAAEAPRRDLPPLEAQAYALIGSVLKEEHGAIRRTAARLGMSHQKLLRHLEKWPELRPKKLSD